jgi:hypothetical protein
MIAIRLQVCRVVLGLRRCPDRFLGQDPRLRGVVLNPQPRTDELAMPFRRPCCTDLGHDVCGQPQRLADMLDDDLRHLIQLREVAQPLVALQPDRQGK